MMGKFKPKCKLIGEDGNIFNLWRIAAKTLERNGLKKESSEMGERIQKSKSYYEALAVISDYVTIVGNNEKIHKSKSIENLEDSNKNGNIGPDIIVGTFIVVGTDGGEEFISLSKDQIEEFEEKFWEPEEITAGEVENSIRMEVHFF